MDMNLDDDVSLTTLIHLHCNAHVKVICIILIVSTLLGVCKRVVFIILLVVITGVVFLFASLLYRYVGSLLYGLIVITLALYVHDVDTLLAWTLGFLFGILSVFLLSIFYNTALYRIYLVSLAHVLLVLATLYAKVDSMAKFSAVQERKHGLSGCTSAIWWCFSAGIMSGAFYTSILEELTYYDTPAVH